MKRLSQINESVFDDIISRSKGDGVRKEDDLGIKNLKPIDLGLSVLWADGDLKRSLDNKEIEEIKFSDGWRLPTRSEAAELCNVIDKYGDYDPCPEGVYYKFNGNRIKFDIFFTHYRCWTSTKSKSGYWVLHIPALHLLPEISVMSENKELPVRLVKEKV